MRVSVLFLSGCLLAAGGCASSVKSINLSPYSDLSKLPQAGNKQKLENAYTVVKKFDFGPDPDLYRKSVRQAKEGIFFEVPNRSVIFKLTYWDLPLIKSELDQQGIRPRDSAGEEVRTRLLQNFQNYTQFRLLVESHVNNYFIQPDWTIRLEDAKKNSYFPEKVEAVSKEELVLPKNADVLGKKSESVGYKVYNDSLMLMFKKIDLSASSPMRIVLLHEKEQRKVEFNLTFKGKSPEIVGVPESKPAAAPSSASAAAAPANTAQVYMDQGQAYFLNGQYAEAISLWEKVLELEPANFVAEERIAEAKTAMVEKKEEKKIIEDQSRRQMQIHFLMGTEYFKDELYREAISEWEQVLKIDPDHALSKMKIAKAKEKLGQ